MKTILTLSILLLSCIISSGQGWPKVYGTNTEASSKDVFEVYDKGYLIVGNYAQNGVNRNGWLIKTDINGNILWNKKIGLELGYPISKVIMEDDGSYYLLGNSYKLDSWSDAMIIKLNKCGEEEWCKIFHIPDDPEYGVDMVQLPSGNLIAYVSYFGTDISNERLWLFKLNPDGDVIWQKLYGQQYPELFNEDAYEIILDSDYNIIMSAKCFYPNPGVPQYGYKRPFFLKIDSSGNELWELPWGIQEYVYGAAFCSAEDQYGNYYGGGRHTEDAGDIFMDHPALFKFSNNGEQIYYQDIVDFSEYGSTTTIDFYTDTTLIMAGGWCMTTDSCYKNCYLLDTLGNILNEKFLIMSASTIRGADITHDKKILMTGGFCNQYYNCSIHFWKLNSDLEDDTLYTQTLTYDSLCPDPIQSDTIACNCTVVNIEEQAGGQLELHNSWIYPNPAREKFKIHCRGNDDPQHDHPVTGIEIYNLLGEKIRSLSVPKGRAIIEIDASGWQSGMYVVVLMKEGRKVDQQKLVVVD
ncbi:MAG: T9SS type A sorting domain-containing protein [Bacteroidales bacterium]|nr:T9SS type A sorting domain-containing protein [Bacteroidales bacterium]